jgi:hypothetical protein
MLHLASEIASATRRPLVEFLNDQVFRPFFASYARLLS